MDRLTWTEHVVPDAKPDLAHAFKVYIQWHRDKDSIAKNAKLAAETLILMDLNDTNFPVAVVADDEIYVIGCGTNEDDSPYLKSPIKAATSYYAGAITQGAL